MRRKVYSQDQITLSICCREEFSSGTRLYLISLSDQDPYCNDVVSSYWTGQNIIGCCRGDTSVNMKPYLNLHALVNFRPKPWDTKLWPFSMYYTYHRHVNKSEHLLRTVFSRRVQLNAGARRTSDHSKCLHPMTVYRSPGETRDVDVVRISTKRNTNR